MPASPVKTRRDRRRFVDLSYRLHRDSPYWVPPLRRDVHRLLDRRHPYLTHSATQQFLVTQGGQVVGRLGLHENTIFNRVRARRWAFFHMFEATDQAAADDLFGAAVAWTRERGLERLVGPMGFMPGEAMGLLVDGFEHPGSMATPWTPEAHVAMMEAAGFTKETDFRSGVIERPFEVPDALFDMGDAAAEQHGLAVKTFGSRRELRTWIHHIGEVYNEAFRDNWEYRPVTHEEMAEVARQFLPIANPRLILLLMKGDAIVGFLLILPEVRSGLMRARGRLLPIGWWHILRSMRTTDVVDMLGMGVVPEFQGAGANAAIYARVARGAARYRYVAAEVVQVEEGNTRMNRNMEAFGVRWNKRHRVYGRVV